MSLHRRHLLPFAADTRPAAAPEHPTDAHATGLDRRALLSSAAGGLVASMTLGNPTFAGAAQAAANASELVMMDALPLSQAIQAKQVSCVEVMTAYLDHIERVNPAVNAIVSLQPREDLLRQAQERDAQLARGEYLGWMHGMPQAVKDLAATQGIRTTFGSPLFKDFVPETDGIMVARMKRSGAIVIGKTNTPEFGLGSQTYNEVFGTTLNAYDQSRIAGGSSGGAAVSLALRMLPVADGSDMMGSLRNPGAFNNVFGFRPSFGRVPSGPAMEVFVQQLGYEGPMGRTVSDLAMLLSIQAGHDARAPLSIEQDPAIFAEPLKRDLKGTRIAWLGDFGGYLAMEPGVKELCQSAFPAFETIGCQVEEALPDFPPEKIWDTWLTWRHWLISGSLGVPYSDPAKRALMKPEAVWEVEGGLKLSASDVYKASVARSAWYQAVRKMFETYDFLALPTAQVFPFDAKTHWPKEINGRSMDTYHRWMEVVTPATLSGCPTINVPVGFNAAGLPMGMQLIGPEHADLAVLQIAYGYEQATGWVQKRLPPLLERS